MKKILLGLLLLSNLLLGKGFYITEYKDSFGKGAGFYNPVIFLDMEGGDIHDENFSQIMIGRNSVSFSFTCKAKPIPNIDIKLKDENGKTHSFIAVKDKYSELAVYTIEKYLNSKKFIDLLKKNKRLKITTEFKTKKINDEIDSLDFAKIYNKIGLIVK